MSDFFKKYKNDLFLVFSILLVALIFFLILIFTAQKGKSVKVILDGNVEYVLNLNQNTKKTISQNENHNLLIIKDGKAYIKSADCPDKICVHHKPISNVGETIVCLPNRVVIEIE